MYTIKLKIYSKIENDVFCIFPHKYKIHKNKHGEKIKRKISLGISISSDAHDNTASAIHEIIIDNAKKRNF